MKKVYALSLFTALLLSLSTLVNAQAPNFSAAIYADGDVWGTKGVASLPAPNDHNVQSYDMLFLVINSNTGAPQLPVAEAAPGNPAYNGGRWFTHIVEWTTDAFADYGTVPLLTSYDDILENYELGYLTIEPGTLLMGPPPYFECPLLPVK